MRKQFLAAAFLIAAAVLWTQAMIRAQTLMSAYSGVSVRMSDSAVTLKQLKKILPTEEADGLVLTAAWTRSDPLTAKAASMQTSTVLSMAAVYGDMRRTEPLMTLLCGSIPAEDDADGCLIDVQSALALFRSAEPIGAMLSVDGCAYTVRGVVKAYAPTLFVRDENRAYDHLEFATEDVSLGEIHVDAYLNKYALEGSHVVIQSGLYARIAWGLVFLPIVFVLFWIAIWIARLIHADYACRGKRCWKLLLLSLAAMGALVPGAVILRKTFYWPQSFLPTRASDFSFWRILLSGWKETWESISLLSPLPGDVLFFRGMRACVWRTTALLLMETIAACRSLPRQAR